MKHITVLDFEAGKVFQYNLDKFGDNYIFIDENTPQHEELEDIIVDQGHNLSNCEWMSHEDPKVITNK